MTQLQAWTYIVNNWHCPNWQPIPQDVSRVIGLDSRLGMTGGMLVTRNGAKGVISFVNQLNSRKDKSQ